MESVGLLDRAGRRRSQATLSGFHQGRAPRNKGLRYPPDPPPVEEIIAVMRAAGDGPEAMRVRRLIIVLWRAGLRISEAWAERSCSSSTTCGRRLTRSTYTCVVAMSGASRWLVAASTVGCSKRRCFRLCTSGRCRASMRRGSGR